MQDLSSEDLKKTPKNYQKQPENYSQINFGYKNTENYRKLKGGNRHLTFC